MLLHLTAIRCNLTTAQLLFKSIEFNSIRCLIAINQWRGLATVDRKLVRTRLPRYKKKLVDLPALTDLLTSTSPRVNLEETLDIRRQKLQVYKEYLPIGSNANYIEAIFSPKANNCQELLNIIELNLETLNSFHLGCTFEALDDLLSATLCEPEDLAQSKVFKFLCTKALYKMRHFESDEVLKLLKCLSRIGVNENTLIIQAALQMTRHHINEFNLKELDMLKLVLDRFDEIIEPSKSLLIALKAVVPKAREKQIKGKLLDEETLLELEAVNK